MAKFTKTNNKVSFFKIAQSKYNELLNATEGSEIGIIAGAIYFVEDGNVGRIYVDKKCYGEANLSNSVTNVTLENEGENAGKIKVTYSTGDPTYIPLPEGKVYTAGKGIETLHIQCQLYVKLWAGYFVYADRVSGASLEGKSAGRGASDYL